MINKYNFYWQIVDSFTQWEGGGGGTGQELPLNNLYYNRKPKSVTSFNSHFFMPADCSFRS